MQTDWVGPLMNWLPFVALILVWIFLSKRFDVRSQLNEFYQTQITEMQRTNALLDRIAVALEKRAEPPKSL